jgi:hypothetical protein
MVRESSSGGSESRHRGERARTDRNGKGVSDRLGIAECLI